MLCEFQFVNLP